MAGPGDVETPYIEWVLALTQHLWRVAGVYPVYPEREPGGEVPEIAVD